MNVFRLRAQYFRFCQRSVTTVIYVRVYVWSTMSVSVSVSVSGLSDKKRNNKTILWFKMCSFFFSFSFLLPLYHCPSNTINNNNNQKNVLMLFANIYCSRFYCKHKWREKSLFDVWIRRWHISVSQFICVDWFDCILKFDWHVLVTMITNWINKRNTHKNNNNGQNLN